MTNGLGDLFSRETIVPRLSVASRKQALERLCETLGPACGIAPRALVEAAMLRERLSGTGVGEGVAIPHARVGDLVRPMAAFARLDPPQDFDAPDARAADLVVLLATPAERGADHLKALARVTRCLRRPDLRERLRAARGAEEIFAALVGGLESDAA